MIDYKHKYDDNMNGLAFEEYCAKLLRLNGYTKVIVTRGSGDNGVDILAEKDGNKFAIQCKYYSKKIGIKAVQEVRAGMAYYRCDKCAVLTNSEFTEPAINAATRMGVELWDRWQLDRFERVLREQEKQKKQQTPVEVQERLNLEDRSSGSFHAPSNDSAKSETSAHQFGDVTKMNLASYWESKARDSQGITGENNSVQSSQQTATESDEERIEQIRRFQERSQQAAGIKPQSSKWTDTTANTEKRKAEIRQRVQQYNQARDERLREASRNADKAPKANYNTPRGLSVAAAALLLILLTFVIAFIKAHL